MNFLIISHVKHKQHQNAYFGYAPYVREMNIWLKHIDKLTVVAPLKQERPTAIDIDYKHDHITFNPIPSWFK